MATKSLQLSSQQIEGLIKTYESSFAPMDHPYIRGHIRLSDVTMTVYHSNKVVLQGDNVDFYGQAFEPFFIPHAGSDEVGTGDTFGPVVVVACTVSEPAHQSLKHLPILDSKAMEDATILTIAPTLFKKLPHSKLILENVDYNRIYPLNNLNQIKAKLHNQAYLHLSQKTPLPDLCVIDQFTPKANYFSYLRNEPKVYTRLSFHTKAESTYFAVACASIMARYLFLTHWQKMEETYGITLPKGSGPQVLPALQAFIDRYGQERLHEVAKLNFKTIKKTLGLTT